MDDKDEKKYQVLCKDKFPDTEPVLVELKE